MIAAKSQGSETRVVGGRRQKKLFNGYIVQGSSTGRNTDLKSNIPHKSAT